VDPAQLSTRLAATVAAQPCLGNPPVVRTAPESSWPDVLADFADRRYADAEPLVRVAVSDGTPSRLLIAAHHGAVDGFGLLALLGLALDAPIASNAHGIGDRPAARSFLRASAVRLAEAVFTPPSRAATSTPAGAVGDAMVAVELPAVRAGTATLTVATAAAVRAWNDDHGVATPRVVAALGASRRPGSALAPDRYTAFFRLRVPPGADPATVRRLLAEIAPEPDFPPSRSRTARPLIRALSHRLGATFLASNLGVVRTLAPVESLAFYPAPSGRQGLAIGAVTCGDVTTVSVRARRTGFADGAAERVLKLVVERLTDGAAARRTP